MMDWIQIGDRAINIELATKVVFNKRDDGSIESIAVTFANNDFVAFTGNEIEQFLFWWLHRQGENNHS